MIHIDIPGFGELSLAHIVFDYNGTLAVDGVPIPGVRKRLQALSTALNIHVVTADTFGKVRSEMGGVPCRVTILPLENQDTGKQEFVDALGAAATVSVGNGRNDRLMLEAAALGVAVILEEGASAVTLASADVVCKDIHGALDLLENPKRLIATLRS
jgi:soluble P-type ATPase